jgi:hypothetical protein
VEGEIKYDVSYLYAVSEGLKPAFIEKAAWFSNWRGNGKGGVECI